jgi:hypothetical protein
MYKFVLGFIALPVMAAWLFASVGLAQPSAQNTPLMAVDRHGPRPRPPSPADDLPVLNVEGKVQSLTVDPRGLVDGFVLDDGTRVRAGRKARLERLALKPGDRVTVSGRGGSYPAGKVLQLETIRLADGRTLALDVPPERQPAVTREGTVERVLLNPEGDVDAILLADRSVIHMRPCVPEPKLVAGVSVRAEGHGSGTFMHADQITLLPTGTRLEFSARRGPRAQAQLEDSGAIALLIANAEGETDALVMHDGAVIKLPPLLRDQAASALQVGARIDVRGEGGVYGTVKAFRAERLQLASGTVFAAPGPARPRPDVAP